MSAKWLFIIREHTRQLWFRASLYCILAVISAFLGLILKRFVPTATQEYIRIDTVHEILQIMASSMLMVAIFSLSVMVHAYDTAATTATPRATKLLTEDTSAQNALAAFIGAFLFSIVGLIALSGGIYGDGGTVVLFFFTILVVVLVIVMLLRWIEYLSRLGRVEESISLVEDATRRALLKRAHNPFLGGIPLVELPAESFPVDCQTIGYVQYIDMDSLQEIAQEQQLQIYINVLPGRFCDGVIHIAYTSAEVEEEVRQAICEALVIGDHRTFEQDPRFGFIVLAEIAMRALSPSMNDPGTAINVIGTCVRLFHFWASERGDQPQHAPVQYDRVWARRLNEEDFFDDAFSSIARDAAGSKEVCIRLAKALRAINGMNFAGYAKPARRCFEDLLERTGDRLTPGEYERVKAVAESDENAPAQGDAS